MNTTNDASKVKDWINQVYADACIELEANVATVTATLTAGTGSYNLSTLASTVVRIKEMYSTPVGQSQRAPLRLTTLDQILSWRQASGGAAVTTGTVTHYTLVGLNQIEFWPNPSTADVLTIFAVLQPTALSGNSDVTILPEPFASKILEYGALAEAADFKSDPSEQEYRALFEQWKQRLKAHMTRRAGSQPGQFNMFPGGWFPPHDPSTDLVR